MPFRCGGGKEVISHDVHRPVLEVLVPQDKWPPGGGGGCMRGLFEWLYETQVVLSVVQQLV